MWKLRQRLLFRFPFGNIKKVICLDIALTQPAITCSKLIIETVEEGVKYVLDVKYVLVHTYGYAYYLIKKRIGQ